MNDNNNEGDNKGRLRPAAILSDCPVGQHEWWIERAVTSDSHSTEAH